MVFSEGSYVTRDRAQSVEKMRLNTALVVHGWNVSQIFLKHLLRVL